MGTSTYTEEIGNRICEILSTTSRSLRQICKDEGMPCISTVCKWLNDFPQFSEQYARAKKLQADILADEVIEIADDRSNDTLQGENGEYGNSVAVARARLQMDARKWYAGKLAPKKYGEKLELSGDKENPIHTKNEHRFIIEDMSEGSEKEI